MWIAFAPRASTDNVVDLMVGKLRRLPPGHAGRVATAVVPRPHRRRSRCCRRICRDDPRSRSTPICGRRFAWNWSERAGGLVSVRARPHSGGGLFADPGRVPGGGTSAHRQTARERDAVRTSSTEAIFDIVNQLDRAARLISSDDEREHESPSSEPCSPARRARASRRPTPRH